MELFKEERSSRGRALKRPRAVYEPPSDFEDTDGEEGEDLDEEDEEEEEEDEDTDLSGFICDDDDLDSDDSYDPDEDEEDAEDTEDEEEEDDPMVVTKDNMIDRMSKFGETLQESTDEAVVLASMVAASYKFPFLKEKYQIKLYPYYKRKEQPPIDLVKEAFGL